MRFEHRFRLAYYGVLGASVFLVLTSILFLQRSIGQMIYMLKQSQSPVTDLCGCGHYFNVGQHPLFWGGIITLTVVLLVFGMICVLRIVRDVRATRRFISSLIVSDERTWKIGREIVSLRLVESRDRQCFTVGLLRPTIYCSRGVWNTLTPMERDSVLLHEYAHCMYRDSLVRLILRGMLAPLALFPLLKNVENVLVMYQEHRADQYVLKRKSKKALVSAFLKMTPHIDNTEYGMARFNTGEIRLRYLLGEKISFPFTMVISGVLIVCVFLIGMNIAFAQGTHLLSAVSKDEYGGMTLGQCETRIQDAERLLSRDPSIGILAESTVCPLYAQTKRTRK